MKKKTHGKFNILEGAHGTILVITDAPPFTVWDAGLVMSNPSMRMFGKHVKDLGYTYDDFTFITPCPPIPEKESSTEGRVGKFISEYREEWLEAVEPHFARASVVVCLGKVGNRQHAGKVTPITKVRGTLTTRDASGIIPVLPMLSPAHVLTRPENEEIFHSDMRTLKSLDECGWSIETYQEAGSSDAYEWCLDLQKVIDSKPSGISVDCETVGLGWHKENFRVLSVSVTTAQGNAFVVPLDIEYWNDPLMRDKSSEHLPKLTRRMRKKLKDQLTELLTNPKICTVGHHFKFDIHALDAVGIPCNNWFVDTLQMAFCVDENMMSKSLTECTRRWVPAMAGYSDAFDKAVDKSRMQDVKHADMLAYAGGDTDAVFRLAKILMESGRKDTRNWNTFIKVQMPMLRAFVGMEKTGLTVDRDSLEDLESRLGELETEMYSEMVKLTPQAVLKRHVGKWSYTSPAFIRDILFSKDGFGLVPKMFTPSTAKLEPEKRIPSTSAKTHLPFFTDNEFVQKLQFYSKLNKMRTTYVGTSGKAVVSKVMRTKTGLVPARVNKYLLELGIELPKTTLSRPRKKLKLTDAEGKDIKFPVNLNPKKDWSIYISDRGEITETKDIAPSGFYQHITDGCELHTSFSLHTTVTGRSASSGPNLQNIPKRGELAKLFRKVFVAPKGYKIVSADLSQAEIRVAGWMANDKELIKVYKSGGDVHSATAAGVIGKSYEQFMAGRKDDTILCDPVIANQWKGAGDFLKTFGNNERMKVTVADFCDFKRYQAKAVNFGFLYGMSAGGFRMYAKLDYGIDMTRDEATETREAFFTKYSGLRAWHSGMKSFVYKGGYVRSLHGALRRLQSINSDDEGVQSGAVRNAINSPVQRFASDLGLMALHRLIRDCPPDIKPILFIHDDVGCLVPDGMEEEFGQYLRYYMENNPLKSWFNIEAPFPIVSDVSIGQDLGSLEERPDIQAVKPPWYQSGENPEGMLEEEVEDRIARGFITCD
tara:strand:+ start:7520 stop:10489 length:2970 start_codon:yes stop_codon:yes gene_type:complete